MLIQVKVNGTMRSIEGDDIFDLGDEILALAERENAKLEDCGIVSLSKDLYLFDEFPDLEDVYRELQALRLWAGENDLNSDEADEIFNDFPLGRLSYLPDFRCEKFSSEEDFVVQALCAMGLGFEDLDLVLPYMNIEAAFRDYTLDDYLSYGRETIFVLSED